jgi:hypothetical protein
MSLMRHGCGADSRQTENCRNRSEMSHLDHSFIHEWKDGSLMFRVCVRFVSTPGSLGDIDPLDAVRVRKTNGPE